MWEPQGWLRALVDEGETEYWVLLDPPNNYVLRIPKDHTSLSPAETNALNTAAEENQGVQVEIDVSEGVVSVNPYLN